MPRGTFRKPGSALKIAGFAGHCEVLQKAQKRVLTGKTAANISRHFRSGTDCSAEAKSRAPARLFDIVGNRKRNAGGMNGLRSPQGLQCDHDDAFQGNTFHIRWFRPVSFVKRVSRQNANCNQQFPVSNSMRPRTSEIEHST